MRKNRLVAATAAAALLASGLIGATSAQAADRTITVWVPFGGGNLAMWQASADRIEAKNPGLTIDLVGEIDMAKSLAAINAGNGPDISVANGAGNVGWFCGTGAWQNINDLVSGKKYNNPLNMAKTFTPGSIRTTLSGKVRCALPFSSEIFGFYYNKDLLKAQGISVPKTTTQLIAASKKLTTFEANGDIKTAGYIPWAGFMDNDMGSLFLGHMFGARWFNAKGQSSFAADPAWAKAFAWQKEFIRTVYGNGSFATGSRKIQKFIAGAGDFWGGNNDFIKGRVAMLAHADWMSMMWCDPEGWNLNPCTTPAVNFGTAPLPVAPNLVKSHYGSGVMGNNTFGISRGTTNVKDAWIVLKGLATDKTLALAWANANGDPSSLLVARTKSGTNLAYPSFYQAFYNISNHKLSGYHPLLNTSEHLEEAGLQTLMSAWQANTVGDVRNGLRDLAKRVNQIIARNK
jgi:multiple sugar transport system substrate-binding protein